MDHFRDLHQLEMPFLIPRLSRLLVTKVIIAPGCNVVGVVRNSGVTCSPTRYHDEKAAQNLEVWCSWIVNRKSRHVWMVNTQMLHEGKTWSFPLECGHFAPNVGGYSLHGRKHCHFLDNFQPFT